MSRYTLGSYGRRGGAIGMTGGGTLRTGKSSNNTGMSGTGGTGVISSMGRPSAANRWRVIDILIKDT